MFSIDLDDSSLRIRGSLGDVRDPYALEVVDERGHASLALTVLQSPPGIVTADEVSSRLMMLESPGLMSFEKACKALNGARYMLGPLPKGEPASLAVLDGVPMELRRAAEVGYQLFQALDCLHPAGPVVDLMRTSGEDWSGADVPGLIHNRVCPANVLWDDAEQAVTLVGFASACPAGPAQPTLVSVDSAYRPPDADELGHHPSNDLWAAAVTMLQIVAPAAKSTAVPFEPGTPLNGFFQVALAPAIRRRFQSGAEMASAWREAVDKARLRTDPQAWVDLSHALQSAAVRVGLEVGASQDPVQIGRQLLPFGLSHGAVRDIEMLRQIKHDVRGDGDRFRQFVTSITGELTELA